jgi:acyl carrier protein
MNSTTVDLLAALRDEVRRIKPELALELPPDATFHEDCGLDSLDLAEFAARLEQRFALMIPDEHLQQLVSLEATEHYLRGRLNA